MSTAVADTRHFDHLLRVGELRTYFSDFEVLFEEEVSEPEAVARIVAVSRWSG